MLCDGNKHYFVHMPAARCECSAYSEADFAATLDQQEKAKDSTIERLERENALLTEANGKLGNQMVEFSEEINRRGELVDALERENAELRKDADLARSIEAHRLELLAERSDLKRKLADETSRRKQIEERCNEAARQLAEAHVALTGQSASLTTCPRCGCAGGHTINCLSIPGAQPTEYRAADDPECECPAYCPKHMGRKGKAQPTAQDQQRARIEKAVSAIVRQYAEAGTSLDWSEESSFVAGFVDIVLRERRETAERCAGVAKKYAASVVTTSDDPNVAWERGYQIAALSIEAEIRRAEGVE